MNLQAPASYDPTKYYNCFIGAIREEDRQSVYQELYRLGKIKASHFLSDGRLQLCLLDLSAGIEAINAVAKDKVGLYSFTKVRFIERMVKNPDMDTIVFIKTNTRNILHAERIHLSQIVLKSEEAFRKGITYHRRQQYKQAIECYDDAIRLEPEDIRAWYNKIVALAQEGKHEAAIQVAEEVLGHHPDLALLWEVKGRTLVEMGRALEAGDCMSRACELDPDISSQLEPLFDQQVDKKLQELIDACRNEGKNPEADVNFWWGNFVKYANSKNSQRAWICLQMAAQIGPDYRIVSDFTNMMLLPPGNLQLNNDSLLGNPIVRLRDFYLLSEKKGLISALQQLLLKTD